ncbi:LuxR family transcriptional regulator [Brevirhabdus pacifica]|uniref:LuxR family transcriptional regulator n=1 Tax=Brevirhabdus pacifica TaxID=1267768 RepID=A0A1U7DF99_9RHOB|nr:LuxR family transcriptional regulator [Brevirhabdus pacifica]APX88579.1 LuxR family transcriptional regulator [Brevirhabdus pacifica]PJJ86931.1 LuxR family transcriptional regulator [Brevirhabdus pacifica]
MTFDHLHRLLDAQSLEEIWEIHTTKMAEFGFDRLLYGFTRYYSGRSYGDLDDILTLSNHPRAYLDDYLGKRLFMSGPALHQLTEGCSEISWGPIEERFAKGLLTEAEAEVWEFNRRWDANVGYSLGFQGISTRSVGALSLAARPGLSQDEIDEVWQREGRDIVLMNRVMHLKVSQMPYQGHRRPLTPRQIEVLEWVADGKTMQDIAQIVGLKVATVEKHLRLARETLDVETTAQAVAKASIMNQIFVSQPHRPAEPGEEIRDPGPFDGFTESDRGRSEG